MAHIKATRNSQASSIQVQYCSHHCHEVSLGHLRLPHETRLKIASELQHGVTMDKIMDNVRDTISHGINREHLVTKQDVHNIKHQYNIDGISRHPNDMTSVCAWIEEFKTDPNNPVLLFKPQGEQQPEGMDDVGTDDFILVLQTQFQLDMLKAYGHKCICMDATYGVNLYDFMLTSVLVIDEFGEGIPVAWAITNREDTAILVQYLQSLKQKVGTLSPEWFMSDDADQYFNAFRGVFGCKGTKKVLCAWHLDRAWRGALRQHIKSNDKRIEIYHHMRTLLTERDPATFRVQLQQLLTFLDNSREMSFLHYVRSNYCNRVEQWATCFRLGTQVNTNMFIEAFHRLLKIVYLNHKQNRRIDYLLHTLLRISRDKAFERLQKLQKGKYSHRVAEINKRHKAAQNVIEKGILPISTEEGWTITSERDPSLVYCISAVNLNCNCKLACSTCHVCVHMYRCTCLDFALHTTVCKHIHTIGMNSHQSKQNSLNSLTNDINYFTSVMGGTETQDTALATQSRVIKLVEEVNFAVRNCLDIEALKASQQHLRAALTVISAIEQSPKDINPPKKRKIAANTNTPKQLRFFSTKKKKPKPTQLPKPTYDQQKCSQNILQQLEVKFCAVCFKEEDSTTDPGEDIQWISCSQCSVWVHTSCTQGTTDEDYLCQYCCKQI